MCSNKIKSQSSGKSFFPLLTLESESEALPGSCTWGRKTHIFWIFTCWTQKQFAVKNDTEQQEFSASTSRQLFKLISGRLSFKMNNPHVSSCSGVSKQLRSQSPGEVSSD